MVCIGDTVDTKRAQLINPNLTNVSFDGVVSSMMTHHVQLSPH